jgi:hypothetical protein
MPAGPDLPQLHPKGLDLTLGFGGPGDGVAGDGFAFSVILALSGIAAIGYRRQQKGRKTRPFANLAASASYSWPMASLCCIRVAALSPATVLPLWKSCA